MTELTDTLFIGGVYDGRWMKLARSQTISMVAIPSTIRITTGNDTFEADMYRAEYLREKDDNGEVIEHKIMVDKSIKDGDIIGTLIRGYRND